jgi:hypothetical protein
MRRFVRWSPAAMAVLTLTMPLAAQGWRGPQVQGGRAQGGRPPVIARSRGEQRPRVVDRRQAVVQPRVMERSHVIERPRLVDRPRVVDRPRAFDAPRVVDRGRPGVRPQAIDRGRVDRGGTWGGSRFGENGRRIERWPGETRWREDHSRIVLGFFSSPRYRYVPRYAFATLPFGWDQALYEDGYFPPEYDAWCDTVPVQLEYQLPPLYRGYRRFIFGDRLIVMDQFTRRIVLVVRI